MAPYPFSKGVFICGEPLLVRHDAVLQEMEEGRVELENRLNRLTAEADDYFKST